MALIGMGGPARSDDNESSSDTENAVVQIAPSSTGPAVFVTEATLGSAQVLANRTMVNWDANVVSDLTFDSSAVPLKVELRNLHFNGSGDAPDLAIVGVESGSDMGEDGISIAGCSTTSPGVYARNVEIVGFYGCRVDTGSLTSRNMRFLRMERSFLEEIDVKNIDGEPNPGTSDGRYYANNCELTNVTVDTTGTITTYLEMRACHIQGDVTGTGNSPVAYTSDLKTWNCHVEGNVTLSGNSTWDSYQDRIDGNLTFTNADNNRSVTLNNTSVMGTVTDAAVRLTYNNATLPTGGGVFEVDTTPTPDEIQPLIAYKDASFVVGSQSTEDTGTAADDSRMFFHKGDYSFRAGRVLATQWDSANRGNESAAFGFNTTASGTQSFASGSNVTASAAGSQAWGNNSTVSSTNAVGGVAEGNYAKSYLRGQVAHASDRFQIAGDGQYSRVVLTEITIGATTVEMYLDLANTQLMNVPTNMSWAFEMLFVARQSGGGGGTIGNSAAYKAIGCLRDVGGTTTLVGSVTYTTVATDDATWPTPVVDVTGTRLRVRVTGVANQNIKWVAAVHLTEVFQGF